MKLNKKIGILIASCVLCIALLPGSSCKVHYGFHDKASIPDSIKTVYVKFFENRARYVNPQLAQKLTDRLRQKLVSQTKLTQVNNEDADWVISAEITDYTLSTSAISGQKEAGNRLTVGIHVKIDKRKQDIVEENDVSRNFEFSASQSLQQAEAALSDQMVRDLTDDIFNRLFSGW